MADKETLDQIRARIAHAEAQESEVLRDHAGVRDLKEWGQQHREEVRRADQEREAARQDARRARRDAEMEQLKAKLKNAYLGAGGDPEGYEAAWPALRDREIERRTLERAEKARQQSETYYREAF